MIWSDVTYLYDNSSASHPLRLIATYEHGELISGEDWPAWAPDALR